MTPIDDKELAEIEARLKAATHGEGSCWSTQRNESDTHRARLWDVEEIKK